MARSAHPIALVTGGAGFIGSHLCDSLLADGWEVYAVDDLSTGSLDNVAHLKEHRRFHLVVDSVLNEAIMNTLIHRSDAVWHMAAAVGVRLVVEEPVRTLLTNVRGTEVVLEFCSRFDKPVFVASTSEVYGDHQSLAPLAETERRIYGPTTVNRWGYAASKAIDEFLALSYFQERDLQVVIGRLFNTVGPRQTGRYGMVVPSFVQSALSGTPLQVFGSGDQTRCFCHVFDTVVALKALLAEPACNGLIFNIGNTTATSIRDLAERVITAAGSRSEIEYLSYDDAYGPGFEDMLHRVPDIGLIQSTIGWAPTRPLEEIIGDLIAHERAAGVPTLHE